MHLGYLAMAASVSFGETTWEAANGAYQNGKYEEAKVGYLQLVRAGQYSADLFYNLGNAWFKLGDQGRAILNYERALLLNPRLDEAAANLRTAFKIVGNDDAADFSRSDRGLCRLFSIHRVDRFLDIRIFSLSCLAQCRALHGILAKRLHCRRIHFYLQRSRFHLDRLRIKRFATSPGH